jgi:hypothetical protein
VPSGYNRPLYLLALDHRRSFERDLFDAPRSSWTRSVLAAPSTYCWPHDQDRHFRFELLVPARNAPRSGFLGAVGAIRRGPIQNLLAIATNSIFRAQKPDISAY